MGNRKKDEEENGILDTMGDAFATAGEYLSDKLSGGRFTEEGLKKIKEEAEKKKKEKPKKVTAKPKPTPQRVSQRTQRADSVNGTQFNTVTQTDNRTKEMKEQPPTPINTDLTEAQIRNRRIQKRIDALKKRRSND